MCTSESILSDLVSECSVHNFLRCCTHISNGAWFSGTSSRMNSFVVPKHWVWSSHRTVVCICLSSLASFSSCVMCCLVLLVFMAGVALQNLTFFWGEGVNFCMILVPSSMTLYTVKRWVSLWESYQDKTILLVSL